MAFALLSSAQPAPRVNEDATEPRNGRHRAGARALPVLGGIAIPLTDSIEIVAEGGRLSNLNPELLDTFLAFSPLDFRLSAWYGETGVRFLVPSRSAVTPYAEATAGFAHLKPGLDGIGGTTGALIDAAFAFLDRTEPMLGVGDGVIGQGGRSFLTSATVTRKSWSTARSSRSSVAARRSTSARRESGSACASSNARKGPRCFR
jgi:hypothetical protein